MDEQAVAIFCICDEVTKYLGIKPLIATYEWVKFEFFSSRNQRKA